jgi:hypothetical protein
MSDHDRRVYLNHIRRLQEQNRLLAEMLTDERAYRKRAYDWYRGRLRHRWSWIVDIMLLGMQGKLFEGKK